MTDSQTQVRIPNLGKLAVAIIEHLTESIIGESAKDEIKSPMIEKELRQSLVKALENTEKLFGDKCNDVQVREAILNLPLANLPSVWQATREFYSRPNDPAFSKVLYDQINGSFPFLSRESIKSGVDVYIAILRDELVNLNGDIREKIQAQATLQIANTLDRIEKRLSEIISPTSDAPIHADRILGIRRFRHRSDFVGRKKEISRFRNLVGKIEKSEGKKGNFPTVLLISGEGGIGKSWLVNELCAIAEDKNVAVLLVHPKFIVDNSDSSTGSPKTRNNGLRMPPNTG